MMFSYFLLDTVDREELICANNDLIMRSDELWIFGEISDGVDEEIKLAKKLDMPTKYFSVNIKESKFAPVDENTVLREE